MNETNETRAAIVNERTIASMLQSPMGFILLIMVLGGQGADLFASNNYTLELRGLRADVEQALREIADNSERIGRAEERLDRVSEEVRSVETRIRQAEDRIEDIERGR